MEQNTHALAVRAALGSGVSAAEKQLAIIGTNFGDEELKEVIKELTPAEISIISSEGDMTKPSILHSFITPEQFVLAFKRIGARWGAVDKWISPDALHKFQDDISDFLCPVILGADNTTRRSEVLSALLDVEHAEETLFMLSLDRKDSAEFFSSPTTCPITHGTWQELLQVVVEYDPSRIEAFRQIRTDIAHSSAQIEIKHPEDELGNVLKSELMFARDVVFEIQRVAQEMEEKDPTIGKTKEEEFFDI